MLAWRVVTECKGSLHPPGCRPQTPTEKLPKQKWGVGGEGTQGQPWGKEDGNGTTQKKGRTSSASRQLKITALISLSEITTGLESNCLKREQRKEKATSTHWVMNSCFKEAWEGLCACEPGPVFPPGILADACLPVLKLAPFILLVLPEESSTTVIWPCCATQRVGRKRVCFWGTQLSLTYTEVGTSNPLSWAYPLHPQVLSAEPY